MVLVVVGKETILAKLFEQMTNKAARAHIGCTIEQVPFGVDSSGRRFRDVQGAFIDERLFVHFIPKLCWGFEPRKPLKTSLMFLVERMASTS